MPGKLTEIFECTMRTGRLWI